MTKLSSQSGTESSRNDNDISNPYIGPRSFRKDPSDQSKFFGRDTEKEYLQFMVELNKHDDIIPTKIQKKLQKSSLLFLGYNLEDINFRSVFQGLLNFLGFLSAEERKISISSRGSVHLI